MRVRYLFNQHTTRIKEHTMLVILITLFSHNSVAQGTMSMPDFDSQYWNQPVHKVYVQPNPLPMPSTNYMNQSVQCTTQVIFGQLHTTCR